MSVCILARRARTWNQSTPHHIRTVDFRHATIMSSLIARRLKNHEPRPIRHHVSFTLHSSIHPSIHPSVRWSRVCIQWKAIGAAAAAAAGKQSDNVRSFVCQCQMSRTTSFDAWLRHLSRDGISTLSVWWDDPECHVLITGWLSTLYYIYIARMILLHCKPTTWACSRYMCGEFTIFY